MIVGVNLALLALYFWSRGGATTDVRIEAIGSQYRAFVDGKLVLDETVGGPPSGGIGFQLRRDDLIPSLPKPSGIDSIRVTDHATGDVLVDESFDEPPGQPWEELSGDWYVSDGVLATTERGMQAVDAQPWTDYVLEAKLRNVPEFEFSVRMNTTGDRVIFGVRPYRAYDATFVLVQDGSQAGAGLALGTELDRGETIRSITAMLLRPYPIALIMILAATLVAFFVRIQRVERALRAAGAVVLESANGIVLMLAIAALALLWYINYFVGDAMPHVPDSVAYVFQSKIFASFRLTADEPPVPASFAFFEPPFLHVVDGRWFSQYPFGHPLFLSVGTLFHAPWLVPPVLGAASVYLIQRVGTHVYGAAAGLLAAVLLFFSPFFQMTASNFMSHNTAVFVILFGLFLLVRPTKRRALSMFVSGVCLGLVLNIRPLVAVALIPPLGALMTYDLWRAGPDRARLFRHDVAFAAGAVLLLLAYFLYNNATTGEFTDSPQMLTFGDTSEWVGFGGRHSLPGGLQNEQALLSVMLLVADGWPVFLGLTFAALPFLLGTRNKWDYFFATSALSLAAAIIFYRNAAIMHGPRFWYETMPFLMLLTARGALRLRDAASAAGDWLARSTGWARTETTATGTAGIVVFGLVAGLIAFSAYGWMLGRRDAWTGIAFVPEKISALEGFNFTDRRLLDAADDLDLENALVLVEDCPHWWCYGSVLWTNSPELDGDVVWAERQGDENDIALLEYYEGRTLYVANYNTGSIFRATEAELLGQVEDVPEEPGQVPAPEAETPAQTQSAEERDQIRRGHLEQLRMALEEYAQEEGEYPDTGGQLQTVCVYEDLDAGCVLASVLPDLPEDPLGEPQKNGYWYVSDGESYVLEARQEELEVADGVCPEDVPRRENVGTIYCVQGQLS
ncbi:MAG: hypothetical protein U1B78_06450 [Dehalococcoidia bacterium]|nr:hypothetical protein [Dehalococcoidia bacterium]